jgi:hypothetical protein
VRFPRFAEEFDVFSIARVIHTRQGGGERVSFEILVYKNAIKHKYRGPHIFSCNIPIYPDLRRNLMNPRGLSTTVHFMVNWSEKWE